MTTLMIVLVKLDHSQFEETKTGSSSILKNIALISFFHQNI